MRSLAARTTLLALLPAALALELADHSSVEEGGEEISLIQSSSLLSRSGGPRDLMRQAAQGLQDTSALAQTTVRLAISRLSGGSSEENVRPAWESDADGEEQTCAAAGITPGVCAISALARVAGNVSKGQSELDYLNPDRLERALFKELEAALAGTHGGFSEAHLTSIEQDLGSIYASLPKNSNGLLGHATVKYAVHQRFLRKSAWYVRSLNPVGEAQTPASPGEALRGQVPEHLQKLLERRQEGRGLGSRELAAFVATLEHLIQGDSKERLKAAYVAHGLRPDRNNSRTDISEALQTYVAHFLSLRHKSGYALTPEQSRKERRAIEHGYPGWPTIMALIQEILIKHAPQSPWKMLPFEVAMTATNEVMKRYESISAEDCKYIKEDIMSMPGGKEGKVRLHDLHKKAVEETSLFAESTQYLAAAGALETDAAGHQAVLVPNYVYGPSNCLGTTSFFDMCCPNECEAIMMKLEKKLAKPEVSPEEIGEVVSSIREIPAMNLEDLTKLAQQRGGKMPLHGYAFATWLHEAFPLECPRPRHEDFRGARQEADVPDSETDYQDAVAKLTFIASTASALREEIAAEEKAEEPALPAQQNASAIPGILEGGLHLEELRAKAAETLSRSGLKLSTGFDGASMAQTTVKVSTEVVEEEEAAEELPKSGLKLR